MTKQEKIDLLARRKSQLAIVEATYTSILESKNKSYQFGTGDSQQSASRQKLKELRDEITWLTNDIDRIEVELGISTGRPGGIVSFLGSSRRC